MNQSPTPSFKSLLTDWKFIIVLSVFIFLVFPQSGHLIKRWMSLKAWPIIGFILFVIPVAFGILPALKKLSAMIKAKKNIS